MLCYVLLCMCVMHCMYVMQCGVNNVCNVCKVGNVCIVCIVCTVCNVWNECNVRNVSHAYACRYVMYVFHVMCVAYAEADWGSGPLPCKSRNALATISVDSLCVGQGRPQLAPIQHFGGTGPFLL